MLSLESIYSCFLPSLVLSYIDMFPFVMTRKHYFHQEYFYGLTNDLSPHANVANFSDFLVYRIGGGPQAPRSALPIGADPVANPLRIVPVNVDKELLHLVLAVSYAKDADQIISRYA